jgi:hypothetical protein
MRLLNFSFKNEAIWSMLFTLVGVAVGGFILLVVYVIRWLSS